MNRKTWIPISIILAALIISVSCIGLLSLMPLAIPTSSCTQHNAIACNDYYSNKLVKCSVVAGTTFGTWYHYMDCPTGQTCSDPDGDYGTNAVCTTAGVCTDTDNGIDLYTKGTASWQGMTCTDMCIGTEAISECYCVAGNGFQSPTYNCPSGYSCSNGACLPTTAGCTNPAGSIGDWQNSRVCKENNVWDAQCTAGIAGGSPFWLARERENCVNAGLTCSSGQCVQAQIACTDSDTGLNYFAQGTVTYGSQTFTDVCVGNDVREYYCPTPTSMTWHLYACNGCSNGACITACNNNNICDAGENYATCPQDCKVLCNATTCPQPFYQCIGDSCQPNWTNILILIGIIVAVAGIVAYVVRRRK